MEKLKIAIVGCGGIANQKHMPSIKTQADKAEMVAFCDIIPERAEKAAKEYGVEGAKVYTDYKELLADTSIQIDVVHVCTPNVAHCPITVAAFEAGKHVMCEKPMAHCTTDAQKKIDALKKYGNNFKRRHFTLPVRQENWERSISRKLTHSEEERFRHGAYSRTRLFRAAVR